MRAPDRMYGLRSNVFPRNLNRGISRQPGKVTSPAHPLKRAISLDTSSALSKASFPNLSDGPPTWLARNWRFGGTNSPIYVDRRFECTLFRTSQFIVLSHYPGHPETDLYRRRGPIKLATCTSVMIRRAMLLLRWLFDSARVHGSAHKWPSPVGAQNCATDSYLRSQLRRFRHEPFANEHRCDFRLKAVGTKTRHRGSKLSWKLHIVRGLWRNTIMFVKVKILADIGDVITSSRFQRV